MFWLLATTLLATPLLIFVSAIVKYQIRNSRSPLRKLPGPPSRSWLYGNMVELLEKGHYVVWDEWMSTYGKTFRYPGMLNVHRFSRNLRFGLQLMLPSLFRFLLQTLEQ